MPFISRSTRDEPGDGAVLLFAPYFHPSIEIGARRVSALASFLGGEGYDVHVVSAFGGHPYACGDEIWPHVYAIPVPLPESTFVRRLVGLKKKLFRGTGPAAAETTTVSGPGTAVHSSQRGGSARRLVDGVSRWLLRKMRFLDDHKLWAWRASKAALRFSRDRSIAIVISSGPPFSTLVAGGHVAKRLGRPHLADLRDPWTDFVPRKADSPGGLELYLLRALENSVMRRSAVITSTGRSVAELLAARYPDSAGKIHVVPNGFDGAPKQPRLDTDGQLRILFAGEIYIHRNPLPLLEALDRLLAKPEVAADRVHLTFMGRCEYFGDVRLADWIKGRKCEHSVTLLPQQPRPAVEEATAAATVLLNLSQQQPLSVPAKTFEHLASGREILLIAENDSDTARLVQSVTGVIRVDPEDAAALDAAFADLYERHVLQRRPSYPSAAEIEGYSRASSNRHMRELVSQAVTLTARTGK